MPVQFDFVWSTRYPRGILSVSLTLSCPHVYIKDYYLSLCPRLRVLVPPCCVHRDTNIYCQNMNKLLLTKAATHIKGCI